MMSIEQTPRKSVKEIFLKASLISASAEQRAFLEEAYGFDVRLKSLVEQLIACNANSTVDGLDAFASQLGATPTMDPQYGLHSHLGRELPAHTIVGKYKLLEVLGEGGMGVVYMAEQLADPKRTVALNLIKPGLDLAQVLPRFDAERHALSLMNHSSIASAIDVGVSEDGRPFFVMELIKGLTITKHCDSNRLRIATRLELFCQVCDAVHHAHQKGVIHRDIKPSNVLVACFDGHAVPKVIDFGVAKAIGQPLTEKTMFTRFGQIIGTLEYMSPEQSMMNQLDVDTRSDVYSLGVLLYELLTGTTPMDRHRLKDATWEEMLRILREVDPPPPSARLSAMEAVASVAAARSLEVTRLHKQVKGELDWITMKALEKDRNRRFDSAKDLADDLRRFLSDQPILSCPPSRSYRAFKLARRG
jgi:serine/threonine protein kinase